MSDWISINDILPPSETVILICNDKNEVMVGEYYEKIKEFITTNFEQVLNPGKVTYWQFLPNAPAKLEIDDEN